MKKIILFFFSLLGLTAQVARAQDWADRAKYTESNKQLTERRVVFLGNSITENWAKMDPSFFKDNGYIGRGISGQTSPQLLIRFRQDVIDLHPQVVIINIGINDIAENTGPYDERFTFGNIVSMVQLAQANGIDPILTSVLPAGKIPWNDKIKNTPDKVISLNHLIKKYAERHNLIYVDYFSAMKDNDNAMIADYTPDGVHPNEKGYPILEKIIKKTIDDYFELK